MVRACDIEAVVAAWSGVPVERLTEDEMTKLVRLVRPDCALARGTHTQMQQLLMPQWLDFKLPDSTRVQCAA